MILHEGQHVLRGGTPIADARAALLLVHGRGASADDIYSLGQEVSAGIPGVALLAPQAAGNTWYPQRFLAPLSENEPQLTSALGVVGRLISELYGAGLGQEKVVLIGFSQGACMTAELFARRGRAYCATIVWTGGLLGPPGTVWPTPAGIAAANVTAFARVFLQ